MRGGLRLILGFMIVFGASGGIETSNTDFELFSACLIGAFGLMLMFSGTQAMNSNS